MAGDDGCMVVAKQNAQIGTGGLMEGFGSEAAVQKKKQTDDAELSTAHVELQRADGRQQQLQPFSLSTMIRYRGETKFSQGTGTRRYEISSFFGDDGCIRGAVGAGRGRCGHAGPAGAASGRNGRCAVSIGYF